MAARRAAEQLTDPMLATVAGHFRALAEPARLKILRLLLERDATVGEIGKEFGFSQANASKHVAVLADAGFVVRKRDGVSTRCAIADPVVRRLCDLMCARALARAERLLAEHRGRR